MHTDGTRQRADGNVGNERRGEGRKAGKRRPPSAGSNQARKQMVVVSSSSSRIPPLARRIQPCPWRATFAYAGSAARPTRKRNGTTMRPGKECRSDNMNIMGTREREGTREHEIRGDRGIGEVETQIIGCDEDRSRGC